jgi:hypothetical protein
LVIVGILLWTNVASTSHVAEQAEQFSDFMRVVRPVALFLILLSWRPVATWLHSQGYLTDRAHERAHLIWPRLAIWAVLVEVTIGQGYLFVGLAATAVYWVFWRIQ